MEGSSVKTNILGTEKIEKLLIKFSVPGIISLVVNAFYNIVDQIFIGQGEGYLGNGATNVIFPLTTFAMAFALMIGDGTASWMSLMLGKKEQKKAARGTAAGLVFAVVCGIIIAVIYLLFLEPLCIIFGATEAILPYALQYGRIISIGLPFCTVCAGYSGIIRADGCPKYNMIGLLTGCLINLIGDPLFIFVLHMGVRGAALATIFGQIANAIINFCYIPRMRSVKISLDDIKHSPSSVPSILRLGISSFISQMVLVVVIAVQNNILREYGAVSEYGSDIPLSALGVTMKVFMILMVVVIGLASGAQPIWGYNYGARQYDRVKKTYKLVIIISVCVMSLAFVLFQFFPMAVVTIFGSSNELYNKFSIKTLRIFLILVPLAGVQLSTGIFFQAVGKPVLASLISLSKQIIFMIPTLFILCPIVGVEGVLWSGPIADALTFLLTMSLLLFSWKSIFANKGTSFSVEESENVSEFSREGRLRYFINGKPTVITIERTFGAGGREVGKKLAKLLEIPYYDSDIIKEAAAESELNAMFMAFIDEKAKPLPAVPNVVPGYSGVQDELSAVERAAEEAECAVLEKVSANGSCVIVGRRADQILKGKCPLFTVFITRPVEGRINIICDRSSVTETEARKQILATDKSRKAYYNLSAKNKWGTASNYNLCLDAGTMGEEKAALLIKKAVMEA